MGPSARHHLQLLCSYPQWASRSTVTCSRCDMLITQISRGGGGPMHSSGWHQCTGCVHVLAGRVLFCAGLLQGSSHTTCMSYSLYTGAGDLLIHRGLGMIITDVLGSEVECSARDSGAQLHLRQRGTAPYAAARYAHGTCSTISCTSCLQLRLPSVARLS